MAVDLALPTTLPKGWNEVRPLPVSQTLQQKVAEITGGLPSDKKVVTVAVASVVGIRFATMVRIKGGWTFNGWVGRDWLGKVDGGAELRWLM